MNNSLQAIELGGVPLGLKLRFAGSAAWLRPFAAPCADSEPVSVPEEDFSAWAMTGSPVDDYAEFCLLCMPASQALFAYDRCVFHAAALRCGDRAWLIAGGSGVGKSTHCRLLREYGQGAVTVINGDKPVLEVCADGSVLVHPSPWNGKEGWHGADAAPLGGLILLQRAECSRIEACAPREAAPMAFSCVFQNYSEERVIRRAGSLTERILRAAPVWKLTSLDPAESAKLLLDTVQKECMR